MARLILATSEGQQAIELRPVNSLGRHPNNSIQLLDKIVSKEHCVVEQRGPNEFVLRDLGSLNGTYINGERVRGEQGLRHGDEIALGSTRARFDDGSSHLAVSLPMSPGVAGVPHAPPQPQQNWQSPPVPQMAPQSGVMPPRRSSASAMPAQNQSVPSGPYRGAPPSGNPSSSPMNAAPQAYGAPPPFPPQSGYQPHQQQPQYGQPPQSPYSQQPPHQQGPQAYGPPQPPQYSQPPQAPQAYQPPPPQQGNRPTAPSPAGLPLVHARQPAPLAPPPQQARQHFSTRVDMSDSARAIGTQIAAQTKGFLPFDQVRDPQQMRTDYERLRITWELSRDIALEHDLDKLLEKVLGALFKFANADRGVILLLEDGMPQPRATKRRDGSDAPIQVSTTILNHVINEKAAVLTHDAALDFASSKGKSMILNRITSAMVVPLMHDEEVLGAVWLDSESLATFQQKDLELVTAVANQASMFIENTLLGKRIEQEIVARERFSRLLSPNVAEQVLAGNLKVEKGGAYVDEATVFNSDIRGFTRMSEGAKAEVMVELLNEYFELMVETIFKYEGTLDKFMGDGIMAFWGSPAVHPDDPIRAVRCALDQMDVLGRFNRKRVDGGSPPLAIGMGIHSGPLVAGYVGSSKALSYTVIGDTANTSARLCGIALSGQIIVSEVTLGRLGNRFDIEELAPAHLKGKEKPLRIFNVKKEKMSAVAKVG